VAGQRARIDELAAEVDRQSGEIARREALLRDVLESRAWRLVSAVREALASIRRALGGGGKGRVKDAR
jgi:DNA-binding winged helix-turn-helix (wHTH) protein